MLLLNFLFCGSYYIIFLLELQYEKNQNALVPAKDLTLEKRTDCKENVLNCFKCDICPYSTNHKGQIKRHSVIHSAGCLHKCEACNIGFTQKEYWRRHMLLHTEHGTDNSQSASASAETTTTDNRTQSSEDLLHRFKCDVCPYSTNHSYHMKMHCLIHSDERQHECEVCHQGFTRAQNLKRHMLLHTGEKPYSCNMCNMSFRYTQSLRQHMRKHL